MKHFLHLILLLGALIVSAAEPVITIPKISTPPKIDGKLSEGEWDKAAAVSMFGYYNNRGLLCLQQPVFYFSWDDTYIYLAMDSLESSSNSIAANITKNDLRWLIGDDCAEIMLAAGYGRDLEDMDFPTYYIAANSLNAIWDAKFKVQRNECHNTWQSGAEMESSTDGSRWVFEMRIPIKNVDLKPVKIGTKWRANFCRTMASYMWVALNPGGALNDARIGADMTFAGPESAVRVKSAGGLPSAQFSQVVELVNNTDKEKSFTVDFNAITRESAADVNPKEIKTTKTIKVPAGKTLAADVGNRNHISWVNEVELTVKDESGNVLLYIPRKVNIPCVSIPKRVAKPMLPVTTAFRYLLSKDELEVDFSARHWLKKVSLQKGNFSAEIKVLNDKKQVVMDKKISFGNETKWTASTKDLAEGDYTITCDVFMNGKKLLDFSDWFQKKIYPWMKTPTIAEDYLPIFYTPVKAKGNTVGIWGRSYKFGANGLPSSLVTQGRDYLTAPVQMLLNGKAMKPAEKFQFKKSCQAYANGESILAADGVRVKLDSVTEYDGFILYRVTCTPEKGTADIKSLQVKVPLNDKYIEFHSASGDTTGVGFMGTPIPKGEGRVYDSYNDSRCVVTTPSFCSLYWVADHDVCFCYAADSDKGWAIRKDAPSVEAWRKNGTVELTIKLIDMPVKLTGPRTMEFAFQTGPTRPLPEGWRSYEDYTNSYAPALPANVPNIRQQIGGDGFTTHGGSHSIHPGTTPAQKARTTKKIADLTASKGGRTHVVGYQYWNHTVKGFPEVRAFRSEWGISTADYNNPSHFDGSKWTYGRAYGDDRACYSFLHVSCCPSYVDYLTYAYDETLKICNLYGFYDDVGYPHPLFRPEFGYGWVDEKGEEHYSTGLWIYRDRWKKAEAVNSKNNRMNMLGDAQHIHAHFMPAYAFIGIYSPCEDGFYNPFPEKDALEYYGSLDKFAAMCPAKQVGQIGMIGLGSYRPDFASFAEDSRVMFMLAAMHDQTLGSFGRREQLAIDSLIEARAWFRAWEKGTEFTGYWQSADKVKGSSPDLKTSFYTRNGSALFLMTNIGNKEAEFTVTPNLKKMGIDASKVKFINAETLQQIPFNGSFKVKIAKHDICMVLCGPDGEFKLPQVTDWKSFLQNPGMVKDFKTFFPENKNGFFGPYKDVMYLQNGNGWGFAQAETTQKLPENFTVSALVSRSFLGIRWDNGSSIIVTPKADDKNPANDVLAINVNGKNTNAKVALSHTPRLGFYPRMFNALRIKLLKDKIEFYCSSDAKTWNLAASMPRPKECAGAPAAAVTGWGQPGPAAFLRNSSKNYNPKPTYPSFCFFGYESIVEEK